MTDFTKDTLFRVDSIPEDFFLKERGVEVFDDMLDRSIPYYKDVIAASAKLLDKLLEPGDSVYDLGCATGTSLMLFYRLLQHKKLKFIGIDNSPPMLAKAKLKSELYRSRENISFLLEDISSFNHFGAGGVILNYTLQFIRPLQREIFLRNIFEQMKPSGVILISEKVISHDPRLNRAYIDIYHQLKKDRGYSELEIAKKREALENILIPFSVQENMTLLTSTGFTAVETYFRWFNFASFIARKPS